MPQHTPPPGPADPFSPDNPFSPDMVTLQSMAMAGPLTVVPDGHWWLRDDHPGGTGLAAAWQLATGRAIRIGVLDSGVNGTHLDLVDSYDHAAEQALSAGPWAGLGAPAQMLTDSHGTRVAGLITGTVTNDIAGMGGAPDARLVATYMDLSGRLEISHIATLLERQGDFDLSNHSWGFTGAFSDNFRTAAMRPVAEALDMLAETGRDGLGTVLVLAGGNGRMIRNGQNVGDDANFHNFANSRHTITVAAIDAQGAVASFSSPGANLLLAAPGVALRTADGLGSSDASAASVSGTSFAAPLVSATVALMLEVNPGLGARDVQEILALTARPTLMPGAGANAASGVNGGGFVFNRDIGFGILDAAGAVRLARHWQDSATAANEISVAARLGPAHTADKTFHVMTAEVAAPAPQFRIEWVELGLTLTDTGLRDLAIELISPAGTRSLIAPNLMAGGSGSFLNFTFSTAALRGEDAAGQWQVELRHPTAPTSFVVYDAALTFHGGIAAGPATTYITSAYEALAAADPSRLLLMSGAEGAGVLNAAATTAALDLDLARGTGMIGSAGVTLGGSFASLIGGAGSDRLTAAPEGSALDGAAGNDTIAGGAGADTLFGGSGIDTLDYSASVQSVAVRLWNLTASGGDAEGDVISGFENIIGGSANDTLTGDNAANVLTGGAGNDFLFAVGGDDLLYGGSGNDSLYGGAGDDTIHGEQGNDIVYGGAGADALFGGDGIDTLNYSDDPSGVTVNLATGTGNGGTAEGDTFEGFEIIIGGAGHDRLTGDAEANRLEGGAGNDMIAGGAGADTLFGGSGLDTLDYSASTESVAVRLWNLTASGGDAEGDVISGFENIIGSAFNDTLNGDNGANVLEGGAGNDLLLAVNGDDLVYGGEGQDTLYGGFGSDTLYGGEGGDRIFGDEGNDIIAGGAGADTMYGGAGIDTLDYSGSGGGVQVRLWNLTAFGGDAGGDVYSGFENIIGSAFNDTLNGDNGANVLTGGEGDDFLFAVAGNDLVYGGAGNDTLYGGAGDDTIEGGAGNDRLYGDAGADVFVFDSGHGQDTIMDFSVMQDRLELSSALVDGLTSGADVVAGYASVTGAGVAFDFGDGNSILLRGVTTLTGLEERIDIFGDMPV